MGIKTTSSTTTTPTTPTTTISSDESRYFSWLWSWIPKPSFLFSSTNRKSRKISKQDTWNRFLRNINNFKWHIYDNNGSYNGWFDWLPLWMRVGYWSPFTVLFLVTFYYSMYKYKPTPLQFDISKTLMMTMGSGVGSNDDDGNTTSAKLFWFVMDCVVFLWGISLLIYLKRSKESYAGFYVSFTGWSWMILTTRAGCDVVANILGSTLPNLAKILATFGSALRLPASLNAFITTILWNFIFFPLIYFVAIKEEKQRRGFLKFNFSFFMNNIHLMNLPLASTNTIYGYSARLFTLSDLWIGYLVVALYSMMYLFVLDRMGIHFYPIFCPRTVFCCVSFGIVLSLYYMLMQQANELILYFSKSLTEIQQ